MALLGEDQMVEDYTTIEPQDAVVESKDKEPTGREIIMSLYDTPAPKPEFDTTTPDYLKRAARLNALGRGLSTLGDVFTLKRGGNVNRPTPDNKTGAYVDNYFKYLDDYKNKVDQYNLLDFQNKMRLGQALAGQANTDRSFNEISKRRDEDVRYRESQADKSQERWQKGFDFQKQQYEEQPERQKELYRFQESLRNARKKDNLEEWIAKESLKLQFDKQKNQYVLYDSQGKPSAAVNDEGQIQRLYHVITSDPKMKEEADAMMEVLKAELGEGVTMNHMKVIVSKLWDRSDQAKEFLGVNQQNSGYQIPSMWQSNSKQETTDISKQDSPINVRGNVDVKQKWGSYAR